jgi:hypothetical protein
MDQQEAKTFDAAGFKDMLMSKIKSILPRTEEEADKFKDSGKINQVKSAAQGQVDQKKTEAAGNIEATNKQTPDQSGVNGKEVEALPSQDIGKTPQSIEADKAMPKPMDEAQVETPLEDNSKAMDQQLADNEISDEQLANSNEPAFVQTLDNKNQAQEHSKSAPQQLRVEEQTIVQSNKDSAKTSGDEQVSQMHEDRTNMLGQVEQQQQNTATEDTAERTKIATDINGIFQQTKTDVDSILSKLDAKVQQLFDAAAGRAKSRFESYVDKEMQAYKDERYSGLEGALTWVGDAFTGLPDEVNAFFERGRELYIQEMDKAIGQIANVVAADLNAAKQRIVQGKEQVNQYVEDLPSNLQSIGQEAADNITAKFDELDQSVDAKQSELIDSLAEQYKSSVEAVDSKIEVMKAENRGLFDMAFDQLAGVIGTIVDLKNQLTELFASAVQAITSIINDPIGFLGNLIEGVGMGLNNFMSNITTHLTSGFVEWLTGAMSGIGIELPENIFSLEGIFSLVTQALGLTYDYIRGKAVKLLGERTVKVIEEGFEIFKIIQTDGISGVWEYLKEQFNDLKDTIIGAITEMLVTQVVEAGIKWIIGLMSPAGAFIKAVLMIIDVAQFFIEQGSKIMELVSAFVNSVNAIAAGSLGQVAAFIEDALARSVPILIDFLASLLGVGGIADKVQDIFKSIHDRIDAVIDGFIENAQAWFKDKKGRRKQKKEDKQKEKDAKKGEDGAEDEKDEKEEDKRTEKEQKADFDKGMKSGVEVVKTEGKTSEELAAEVKAKKQKYKLDELRAKMLSETEDMQSWTLTGELGVHKKTEKIERPKTAAENEEQVSEEDRALHEKLAAEIVSKLLDSGEDGEQDTDNFADFYGFLAKKAVELAKAYQPKLRDERTISEGVNALEDIQVSEPRQRLSVLTS